MPEEIIIANIQRKRLDYLDFCKVLAIFLVTVAHCAQQLSGSKFPDLLLTKDSFISVNMSIFMLASGYVMNIDRMKQISTWAYLKSKARRLLLPMTVWYIVMCVVSLQIPRITVYWSLYWYLGAMFICLSSIKILTNFIPNIYGVCVMSIFILTCIPMISFERSCYMIPFLWAGYLLRLNINRIRYFTLFVLFSFFGVMYYFWDISYSIYVSPFHIWNLNLQSVFALFFRFFIGVVGGVVVISASRLLIERRGFGWMHYFAKYGSYTLVFYTMSFVLNAMLARFLWHYNTYIITPGLLDVVAIMVTILMMVVMYYFQILAKKNKLLRLFFLGES